MSEKNSFIFYNSFLEALDELPSDIQLEVYQAISHYALKNEVSDLKGISKAVFALIKPQLDANNKKYDEHQRDIANGKKGAEYGILGGRPKKENPPQKPPLNPPGVISKNPINENVNENVNENDLTPISPQGEKEGEENFVKTKKSLDPFTNPLVQVCFDIYKENCANLAKLSFEPRNRRIFEELNDFLIEIDNDVGYFKQLCEKANKIGQICNKKIDFKMLINNHIGINNGKFTKKMTPEERKRKIDECLNSLKGKKQNE